MQEDDIVYRQPSGGSNRRVRNWLFGGAAVIVLMGIVIVVLLVAVLNQGGEPNSSNVIEGGATIPLPPTLAPRSMAPTTETQSVLAKRSPTGGSEFVSVMQNGTMILSYQSKALHWILQQPDTGKEQLLFQRYALACLYFATYQVSNPYIEGGAILSDPSDIPAWRNSSGWLESNNECEWYGVTCNDHGRVIRIDLSRNLLTGSLPYELSYLGETLEDLMLDTNWFNNRGDEGHAFLTSLTTLRRFSARDTYLQYRGLPPQYAELPNLESLDISYVVYIGAVDANVWWKDDTPVLQKLRYLVLSGNSFIGPLPNANLGRLPSLLALYAADSDVEDHLHALLPQYPIVQELWLDRNPLLTGSLPSDMSTLSLRSLSITRCGLIGSLPTSLAKLTQLQQMWLYDNALTGTIPSNDFLSLTKLSILALGENQLQGSVPNELCVSIPKLETDCPSPVVCECCSCCGACHGSSHERRRLGPGADKKRKTWIE